MILRHILKYLGGGTWKYISAWVLPFVFLPLPLLSNSQEARCGYVMILMAAYWMIEPIPLAATSLMPIVLFPLLGILSTQEACTPYMNSSNMMFVGGLMMAVAIEHVNLHNRIALKVLLIVGSTASWMMLGFMLTAMFLSMWISNTATAALMTPIIDAVLSELEARRSREQLQLANISVISASASKESLPSIDQESRPDLSPKEIEPPPSHPPPPLNASPLNSPPVSYSLPPVTSVPSQSSISSERRKQQAIIRKALFLSVAYATNIGGTGTITGTGPNLVALGVVEEMFPDSDDLSYDKWMMFNVPVMLICVVIAFFYLHLLYIRKASPKSSPEVQESFHHIVTKKYNELGPLSFPEKAVTVLFIFLVMLWIFRDPRFIKGWGSYFPFKVSDATPAIAIPLLLFMIPSDPCRPSRSPSLIDWKTVQAKLPWGIIILLGGGFALAEGSKKSGLSVWASDQLASLDIENPAIVVTILCLIAGFITEFTSNVATANVLLPVVGQLAVSTRVHPIYYMLPVTVTCSFAFVLPVATPPNAIVFEAGNMDTWDMVKPGIFMTLVCIGIELLLLNSLGVAVFDFDRFPDWANTTLKAS